MEIGYIRISRHARELLSGQDCKLRSLFLELMFMANYTEKNWNGITIMPGQLVTSVNSLMDRVQMSAKEIRSRLDAMEQLGILGKQTTNKYTLITMSESAFFIEKDTDLLDDWANKGQTKGEQKASKGQTEGKQKATTKEGNKEIREEGEKERNPSTSVEGIKPEKQKRTRKAFDPSWETVKENAALMAEMREYMITHEKNGRTYSNEKYVDEDLERLIDWHVANKTGKAKGRKLENWKATVSAWQGGDSWIRTWEARERMERMEKLKEETEQPSLNDLRDFFYDKARGKMDAKQATEIAMRFAAHYGAANWVDVQGRPIVWKQKGLSWLEKELEGGNASAPGKGVATFYEKRMQELAEQREKRKKEEEEMERKLAKNKGILRETMQKIMGDQWDKPENQGFIEWYFNACTQMGSTGELVFMEAGITTDEKLRSHMKANWKVYTSHEAQKSKAQAQ